MGNSRDFTRVKRQITVFIYLFIYFDSCIAYFCFIDYRSCIHVI